MDVSLDTIRIIFVARGKKFLAPLLGFFEIFIWIVVITNIMAHANNLVCYIAYAAGFATGNFVGISIEEKIAMGILAIRIFAPEDKVSTLSNLLAERGFGVTMMKGSGKLSDTNILQCVIRRKEYDIVTGVIDEVDKNMFYYAEELKHVSSGVFRSRRNL